MIAGILVTLISTLLSALSLVLIQGVFGKDSEDLVGVLATSLIKKLDGSWSIVLAILSWGISTALLQEFNEFAIKRRVQNMWQELLRKGELDKKVGKSVIKEAEFSKSLLNFTEAILMGTFFAIALISISPITINVVVMASAIIFLLFCKQRLDEGWGLADGQVSQGIDTDKKFDSDDGASQLGFYVERIQSFLRLKNHQIVILVSLVFTPWLLNSFELINILDSISFFGFTALLMFYANSIRLVRQSAVIGYRLRLSLHAKEQHQ